jgi:predicted ATPase
MSRVPVFAGRSEELQLLSRYLHLSERGEPQIVIFEGQPGVGKSSLLLQFSRRAAVREKPGWVISISAPSQGLYDPVAEAAREANLSHRLVSGRRGLVAARELLPAWLAAVPGVGNLVAAIVATASATRERRMRGASPGNRPLGDACRSLLAEAARHPLVVLFDDLHLASPAAIDQLEQLIRGCEAGVHLLLVGAFAAPAPGASDPPIKTLLSTRPSGNVHHRILRELNERELEILLGRRFPGMLLPEEYARALIEQTGGQPTVIEAQLDRMTESGAIRFVDGRWEAGAQRDEVEPEGSPLISGELTSVPPSTIETLRVASQLGLEFDGATVARVMGRDELYVEDRLATALHLRLIVATGEMEDGDGEISTLYRFISSHLRASLARRSDVQSGTPSGESAKGPRSVG